MHTSPEQMAYAESKISCLSALSRSKFLGGSTESRFAAIGSIVAHFTTLRAQKFMNRATRICINLSPSSYYVDMRAQSKRGTKITESEEVYKSVCALFTCFMAYKTFLRSHTANSLPLMEQLVLHSPPPPK